MLNKPLIILGSGGHASVLVDILKQQGRKILGMVSLERDSQRTIFSELKFLSDEELLTFSPTDVVLVNGVGSLPKNDLRQKLYDFYISKGFSFETVIADSAIASKYVELGQGVQILQGVIIQAGVKVGENTIINSGVIVEHDCILGANNHVAPGATLSGGVETGSNVHIGANATVIQAITIGDSTVIGAGAIITKSISNNMIVYPARSVEKVIGSI